MSCRRKSKIVANRPVHARGPPRRQIGAVVAQSIALARVVTAAAPRPGPSRRLVSRVVHLIDCLCLVPVRVAGPFDAHSYSVNARVWGRAF